MTDSWSFPLHSVAGHLMLQALAAEAVRRGYEVRQSRSHSSRRKGGVDVVVDGFAAQNAEVDSEVLGERFADWSHVFPVTHHVECVAILEPAGKGS
jgi:hypothetical protein